ncbi:MAG TPA: patatin-like phospholipase family protein [Gammaproteobacteria bacterium]|nr:patatin-like phospholipase family protein [Gammaproteobacteria bacterium]
MAVFGTRTINLALQGGGAHGAFTWGVLDRLLEEARLRVEGISGTSAGAMNAVVFAHGLTAGGREGAREALARLWASVADQLSTLSPVSGGLSRLSDRNGELTPLMHAFIAFTRFFSPSQLNPLAMNPLRSILNAQVDFEMLRERCPLKLFIAATQVRTGQLRLFHTRELTAEMVLASACLPSLHHPVEIEGEVYWDGGYSANPAVFPLAEHCRARDMVVVLLHPLSRPRIPRSSREIYNRITELSFNATFLREMRAIAIARRDPGFGIFFGDRLARRIRRARFYLIEASELMSELKVESQLNTHRSFLAMLKDQGRAHASRWLETYFRRRRRSRVNLAEVFC